MALQYKISVLLGRYNDFAHFIIRLIGFAKPSHDQPQRLAVEYQREANAAEAPDERGKEGGAPEQGGERLEPGQGQAAGRQTRAGGKGSGSAGRGVGFTPLTPEAQPRPGGERRERAPSSPRAVPAPPP